MTLIFINLKSEGGAVDLTAEVVRATDSTPDECRHAEAIMADLRRYINWLKDQPGAIAATQP